MLRFKCLLAFLVLSQLVFANVWQDLWFTKDQQGQHLLQQNKNHQAAATFKNTNWKGVAYYKDKQYESAYAEFKYDNTAQGLYNQGNALAYMQKYSEAIEAYTKALKIDKNYPDAEYNKEIVEKLLKDQQSKSQDSKSSDSKQQDQQSKQNNSNSSDSKQDNSSNSKQQQNNTKQQNQQTSQGNSKAQDQNKSGAKNMQSKDSKADDTNKSQNSASKGQAQKNDLNQTSSGQANQQPQNSNKSSSTKPNPDKANNATANKATTTDTTKSTGQQQVIGNSNKKNSTDKEQSSRNISVHGQQKDEQDQEVKAALSQVPDDPGGLLRNKFSRDYQRQQQEGNQ